MASDGFVRPLRAMLARAGRSPMAARPRSDEEAPKQGAERGAAGGQARFARYAGEHVMPLLRQTAQDLAKRGFPATARLHDADGRLVAQLEVRPPGLPATARPPLLTVAAARHGRRETTGGSEDRLLLVEFTGTFPGAGAGGGFGAEVEYDTVNQRQLAERIDAFARLAAGAA